MKLVCGVDEAGRGPLAGPVFAAAVILDRNKTIHGLADSKKLSEKKRDALALQIRRDALFWSIGTASVEEIDSINILQASLLAMKRAIERLPVFPDEILVDGLYCPDVALPSKAIVKGDSLIPEISAASILAKTARDGIMMELHQAFPEFGFDRHKGYPTRSHLEALERHGPSSIHRKSFAPVKALLK
ncbi:MAG: ribonuclease HII [Burkholderiales bacterium]|nr:ribonuclease HII [Burkholderiales bacterium]